MPRHQITFVTGTNTGVGKTVCTALLLAHMRRGRLKTLAIKPFCSGSRSDAALLRALQSGELSLDEINPFFFTQPIAPLVAARKERSVIRLEAVLLHIRKIAARCDRLLVEGAGGLLAPLGEGYSALELIQQLGAQVVIAARNKLGVLNHTLLTIKVLDEARIHAVSVVLIDGAAADRSSTTNEKILRELLGWVPLFHLPFLGVQARSAAGLARASRVQARLLGRIAAAHPA